MASSLGSAVTAGRRRPSRPEIIFALVAAAVPDDFEVSASEADHVLSECGFDRKTIDAIMQYLREVETVSACAKCCTSAHKKGRNKIPRPGRCHCVCTGGGAGATVCSPRIHRDDMHDTPSSHSVERNAIAQMLLPSPQRLFFVSTDQDDRHGVPAQGRRHNAERMSGRSLSGSFSSSAPGHMLILLSTRAATMSPLRFRFLQQYSCLSLDCFQTCPKKLILICSNVLLYELALSLQRKHFLMILGVARHL